ncbi:MAG: hypothetical protein E3J72_20755 [Planctomycetota bacterium]|nr:MAG: hypothetical protein E3J72_20755 [Planctomycetota bacterium]
MKATHIAFALALVLFSGFTVGCKEFDERGQQIERAGAGMSHNQREIRDVMVKFFSHLVRQEIGEANLLIRKRNRLSTADTVKWNEEVGRNEARRDEIRAILRDAPLYWDRINVYPEGKAHFSYPPDPSNTYEGVTAGCSVELVKEDGAWRINTWHIR